MELKPIDTKSRIEAVDALRGFALLGILIANIPFAGESIIAGKLDSVMTFLWHLLIDKKFISIFSMLFGFGFYIQMKRAEEKNVNFIKYYTIRMLLLFAIGTLHAFIIWNGDIIRAYAFGGIALLFIRKWSVKRLLITALLFSIFLTTIVFIGNSEFGWRVYNYDYALANELPITTSYFRYFTINAIMDPWVNFLQDMPITLVFTFGNILIGFIMAKVDFFLLPEKLNKLTTFLIIKGITIGFAGSYIYNKIISGEIELDQSLMWVPFVVVAGMISQSIMYISVFLRLYKRNVFKKVLLFFTLVGRTSMSNYIFQSVFYLFVFFHCTMTLQLFGKLTIAETFLIGVLFYLLQSGLTYLWLKNRNQGPLEKIWKGLSYRMAKSKQNSEFKIVRKNNCISNSSSTTINNTLSKNYNKVKQNIKNTRTYLSFKISSTFYSWSISQIQYLKFVTEKIHKK